MLSNNLPRLVWAPFIGSSQTLAEFSGRGVIFQMSSLPGMTWTVSASGGGISSGSSSTLFYSPDMHTYTLWFELDRGSDKWFYEIKWYLFIGLFLIWTLFIHLLMGIKGSSIYCVQAFSPFAVYCTELLFAVTELLKTLWICDFYSYMM